MGDDRDRDREVSEIAGLEVALSKVAHERDVHRGAAKVADLRVLELRTRLYDALAQLQRERQSSERLTQELATVSATAQEQLDALQREGQAFERLTQDLTESVATARRQADEIANLQGRIERLTQDRAASEETTRSLGRRLATAEAQAAASRRRADRFEQSLKALRAGRSYRLMRAMWALKRPFRRKEHPVAADGAVDDDPPVAVQSTTTPARLSQSRPTRRVDSGAPLTVAAILDEMSTACFAPECDLVPLTLDSWAEQLDEHDPHLLLVESAWQGNGGKWQYQVAKYQRKDLAGHPKLRALVEGCRERGIPTVFWNKEDPVHFERFASAAALFDHVFTTDSRCISRYEALPGERTVAALPFAAQPLIHNPVAAVDCRSSSPCFAGAWYRDRHEDRRRALEELLDAARPYGLVIYDRTFGTEDPAFGFPDHFQPHVLGKLPYDRILDVYKSHRVFLNANSVVDSPTMCSRRVFELAACDTAVVSTPGAALSALLGDAVVEVDDAADASETLARLLGDEEGRRRRTRAARRDVFERHTYADRLATIAKAAGVAARKPRPAPFHPPGDRPPGSGADTPWVLHAQPGVHLSADALADMSAATRYADADVIGTAAPGGVAVEHRVVSALDPRAVLVRREVMAERGWQAESAEDVARLLGAWSADGSRLYAGDADWLSALGNGRR